MTKVRIDAEQGDSSMTDDRFRSGGYIPGPGVPVTLHPHECVLRQDDDGGFVCARADHAGRHCGRIEAGRVTRMIEDMRQGFDAAVREVFP